MSNSGIGVSHAAGLRAGAWVEVRSAEEILATLDEHGCLDALPFMPEMLQYCGKKFRVYKSAHKACDTIKDWRTMRRMANAVHLEGTRCDGSAHGGCQAACLLFWKEMWLKPGSPESNGGPTGVTSKTHGAAGSGTARCDPEKLARATRVPSSEREDPEDRYSCQATQHVMATTPIRWWDIRHYAEDIASRNVRLRDFVRHATTRAFITAFQSVIRLNWRGRRSPQFPMVRGLAADKTPVEVLDLKVGELVQVRAKDEIMRTINSGQKNRGLRYDEEMLPYCNKVHRVLQRVERIIDDRSGKMLSIKGSCIILDGVVCSGNHSSNRLFCPRSIYPYWREIWLKRVESTERSGQV